MFAQRLVLPVPAGIGIAPPQRMRGAYVLGGACTYPARTYEPTGIVRFDRGRSLTLHDLFAVWGQPFSHVRLAGFRGAVHAFVGGRAWTGDPRSIPLTEHEQVVLEVGGYVPPHPRYTFPPGV